MVSGAPQDEPFLPVGILTGPHGLKGWARFVPYSGETAFLSNLARIFVAPPGFEEPLISYKLCGVRIFKKGALLLLSPSLCREELRALRMAKVYARRNELPPLEEGEVYLQDLMGLRCVLPNGEVAGVVKDLLMTGSTACLWVEGPKAGYLLYHHDWVEEPNWKEGILPLKRRPLPPDF